MDNNFRMPIHSYRPGRDKNSEADFKTPEQIAEESKKKPNSAFEHKQKHLKKRANPLRWFRELSTRRKIIVVAALIIVLAIVVTVIVLNINKKPAQTSASNTTTQKTTQHTTTVASNLTGLQVNPSVNQRPVTGVMIENSDAARPQSGLIDAGVVFEAVAEGGITRFLALYQDTQPSSIGPIRSLRPYYLSWDMGFDAPIAHVGGSPDALADIQSWGAEDLDQFYNGNYYTRVTFREAPHNVYTSMAELNSLEQSKGYTSSTYTGFPRKADNPSSDPNATSISLDLSSSDYNVSYVYDKSTNSYNRSEGGAPQTDMVTGAQISPKVVIAIVVPETQGALDASGAYYSDYSYLGSGQADVFQDGTVTIGTWQKTSNASQITFTDNNGNTIKLNAGQTWITAVANSPAISYN